jgi:hypothetical protein
MTSELNFSVPKKIYINNEDLTPSTLQGNHGNVEKIYRQVDELLDIAASYDPAAIKRKLQEIVPEYRPQA